MAKKSAAETESKAPVLAAKTVTVTIRGVRPLLMHNGDLADPMNRCAKEIKRLTGSGKRGTDSDDKEIQKARLEFEGGLWLGVDGLPCVPGDAIDSMIAGKKWGAARLIRMGEPMRRAVRCVDTDIPLTYRGMEKIKGVADLLKLYDADPSSVALRKRAVMPSSGSSVMRTRPRFNDWSITFTLSVLTGLDVDMGHVKAAIEMAGHMVGLGDWHGRYGLFVVEKFE